MLAENRLRTKATNMALNPLNLPISRVGSICEMGSSINTDHVQFSGMEI